MFHPYAKFSITWIPIEISGFHWAPVNVTISSLQKIISLTNIWSLNDPHVFSSAFWCQTVNEQTLCTLYQLMALTNHVYQCMGLYRSHSSVFIQKSRMDEPPCCHVCSLNNSCSCWRSLRTLCFNLTTSCFFILLSLSLICMFSWAWKSLPGMFPFQGCMFVHVLCFHPLKKYFSFFREKCFIKKNKLLKSAKIALFDFTWIWHCMQTHLCMHTLEWFTLTRENSDIL